MNIKTFKDKVLRNIPVVGWITGHWMLLAALACVIYAYISGDLALTLRGALLIPIFALMVRAASTFVTNVGSRGVTSTFRRDSDKFQEAFDAMTPFQKILIVKIEVWLWVVVCAMIAAATLLLININVLPA